MESATTGYCSRCDRRDRRLRFAGYASDGRENGDRPRAFYRQCASCGATMLVLGDVPDALSLVRNAILDWKRSIAEPTVARDRRSGRHNVDPLYLVDPRLRTVDLDDLSGEMLLVLWSLYSTWDPARLTFHSYASGLLPRRIASYVRDAVGSDALYRRNGRGNLARVWPKAHATSVCISIDGAAAAEGDDAGDGGGDGLARSLGASAADHPRDRSPDLGRILVPRGR